VCAGDIYQSRDRLSYRRISHRRAFHRRHRRGWRASRVDGYLIDVHLIGAIGVVSGHLIGVCLRHQVWRSASILVSG